MLKKFTPEDEYSNILSQFCYKCERTYRNLSPSVKGKVKDRLPTIFKKWFFSSVMENAVMSPAAILTRVPVTDCKLGENEFTDCDLTVKGHRGGLEKYSFENIIVSADSHPLIDDLKIFTDFCSPVVFLDDELHLDKKAADELKPLLSLGDIYYIDYLTELSLALGIIEKMPSLYTNAYKTSANADEFFSQNGKDILNNILLKVFEICSRKVINDLYISPRSFTAEGLLEYFHTLIPVNDIIKAIFGSVSIDIEAVIEKSSSGTITAYDQALLSSINYVGYLIDRWYITPLSAYLRFVRPIYPDYYNVTEELNIISDMLSINSLPDTEIFMPPNVYAPTPLGKAFIRNEIVFAITEIPAAITPKALYSTVNSTFSADKFNFELEDYAASAKTIFTLKVEFTSPMQDCIIFEFDSLSTLSELNFRITDFFELCEGCGYAFIKKTGGADIRYTYSAKNGGLNATENTLLTSVFEALGDSITLDIPEISVRPEITLIKISSGRAGINYPRPIKRIHPDTSEEGNTL